MHDRLMMVAGVLVALSLPLQALADCKAKLAEVDQRMASPEVPEQQRGAMKMFRDQAADLCSQGHDATAVQTLGMLDMMLPPSAAQQAEADAARAADAATKSRLTNQFLAGRWCSMTGEERAEILFAADGTYQPCFPQTGAQSYVCQGGRRPTAEMLARYERDSSQDPDVIELSSPSKGRGSMVYKRGECAQHGR